MANGELSHIRSAVYTYCAAEGEVECVGIMNAFRSSIDNKEEMYVLTRTRNKGTEDEYTTFITLNDAEGNVLFPLFTDMSELLAIKSTLNDDDGSITINRMGIDFVIPFLAEKHTFDGIVIDPASLGFSTPMDFYEEIMQHELTSHITLMQADITALYTDAVVCFTDGHISGASPIDSAVLQAGGDEFRESISGESLNIGDVVGAEATGELHCKYVLFTRCADAAAETTVDKLCTDCYSCFYNCMNVAKQAEFTSIAFPCIGDESGLSMDIIARSATGAVLKWLNDNPDYNIDVYFCCANESDKQLFQNLFDDIAE